jgi:hypothetical protein
VLDTKVVRVSEGHFCKGGSYGREAFTEEAGRASAQGRLSSLNDECPSGSADPVGAPLKGGIAVKNMIVRLALIGSSISAIVLAGGAGKGLR